MILKRKVWMKYTGRVRKLESAVQDLKFQVKQLTCPHEKFYFREWNMPEFGTVTWRKVCMECGVLLEDFGEDKCACLKAEADYYAEKAKGCK